MSPLTLTMDSQITGEERSEDLRLAVLTLTRVAVLSRPPRFAEAKGGPAFLKKATKGAQSKLKALGMAPTLSRVFAIEKPEFNLSPAGLRILNRPEIRVSVYGFGLASARLHLVAKPVGDLRDFARAWSEIARSLRRRLDDCLEAESLRRAFKGGVAPRVDLDKVETLSKSKRFAFVHVIRGGPLDGLPVDLLHALADPLSTRPVFPAYLSPQKHLQVGKYGDQYFLTGTGIVARLSVSSKGRRDIRRSRKVMRRYIYAAIDLALALDAAASEAGRMLNEETMRTILLYLHPDLWSSDRLVWDSPFYSTYGRLAEFMGLREVHRNLGLTLTRVLTPEQYSALARIVSAGRCLGVEVHVEGKPTLLRDLEGEVLALLCFKKAADLRGLRPEDVVELLFLAGRELSHLKRARLLKKMRDRIDSSGFSRPELEVILGVPQKTISRALERLEAEGLVEGYPVEGPSRTGRRGSVTVFSVALDRVKPLVMSWLSDVDAAIERRRLTEGKRAKRGRRKRWR